MRVQPLRLAAAATAFTQLVTSASAAIVTDKNSTWMATSIMSRSQGIMTGNGGSSELLQAGVTQKAFNALIGQYEDDDITPDIRAYIQRSAASVAPFVLNATKNALSYPLDRLSNGDAFLELALDDEDVSSAMSRTFTAAADALRHSIDLNRRNSEGGLWYFTYPQWSYLDGMYSLAPFYTVYATEAPSSHHFANTTSALDDMLYQVELLWNHTRNGTSGLLAHGYDASKTASWADPATGASPHVWGRSLGWYTMALVDTLPLLTDPDQCKYRDRLLEMFQDLAGAVVNAADPQTGGWWQVLDQPGREGNYIESSGSAMFAYALLKGARLGYLEGAQASSALTSATRAHAYLTKTFVVHEGNGTAGYNGTVAVCSLNSTASYDYYVGQPILYNSVLGSAAYIFTSLEVERLGAK
ncbi:glycoside hydrolase family 105 protein [Whalleya microplaca]|nr:glycoside hydrolase family 105 protein [Whalleya microplaca]